MRSLEKRKLRLRRSWTRPCLDVCKGVACCLVAVTLAAGVCGCKKTDLFTDVIITSMATEVDEDNPVRPEVNTPDSEQKSDELAALDVDDNAKNTADSEMVATWSKKPTSSLQVHHSVFDLEPKFEGVESSDTVKLVYSDTKKALDHEVKSQDEQQENESKSKTTAKSEQKSKEKTKENTSKEQSETGRSKSSSSKSKKDKEKDAKSKSSGPEGDDGANGGSSGGEGKDNTDSGETNDNSGQQKGKQRVKGGGYGDDVEPVYNPADRMQKVQKADHIAAMGQAAVIVQAIGGKGALCAMDEQAYLGHNSEGKDAPEASSFKDVFSDELADDFATNALQWKNDGTSSDDIKDFDELVQRVGANGVILYLGEYGDQSNYFTKKQLNELRYASIQLVPVDLSTVQGILDAVQVVGDALSESKDLASGWSSVQMASDYQSAVNSIVKGVAASNGSSLAAKDSNAASSLKSALLTSYTSVPVSKAAYFDVGTCFVDDFETGVEFKDQSKNGYQIDTTGGIGFTHIGSSASPVSFWAQCAGVVDNAVCTDKLPGESDTDLQIVWQFYQMDFSLKQFEGYDASGPFSKLSASRAKNSNEEVMLFWRNRTYGGGWSPSGGPGSKYFPYVIACANDTMSADAVERAIEKSMGDKDSTYYAYGEDESIGRTSDEWAWNYSNVGVTYKDGGNHDGENAINGGGVAASDVVVENPCGLVSSWTKGTMESVLESVWLADLYSEAPENCKYQSLTDMGKYSADIAGTKCTDVEETVRAFFKTFYRYDLDRDGVAYTDVLTDGDHR